MFPSSISIVAETCEKPTTGGTVLGLVILLGLIGAIVGFAVANGRTRKQLAAATYELNYLRPEYARLQQWLAGASGPAVCLVADGGLRGGHVDSPAVALGSDGTARAAILGRD